MRRRDVIAVIGAAVSWPAVGAAQQSDVVRRVGFFTAGRARNNIIAPAYQAFVEQLRKLGYSNDRNIVVDVYESDQDAKGLSDAAAEIVRKGSDVIVASGTEAALKASIAANSTTPIVMIAINYDPLARGYIKSLAEPGGNITGVFLRQTELAEKQVELLAQTFPARRKLTIISDQFSADQFAAADRRAKAMNLETRSLEMKRPPYDFDAALQAVSVSDAQMLLFLSSPFFAVQSKHIGELASRMKLPTMFIFRGYVENGGLISYGADPVEMYRQAAIQVAKVLRGARPADLPVEQPRTFQLVVNLKTAKAIGLEMPTSILLRADEIIE